MFNFFHKSSITYVDNSVSHRAALSLDVSDWYWVRYTINHVLFSLDRISYENKEYQLVYLIIYFFTEWVKNNVISLEKSGMVGGALKATSLSIYIGVFRERFPTSFSSSLPLIRSRILSHHEFLMKMNNSLN